MPFAAGGAGARGPWTFPAGLHLCPKRGRSAEAPRGRGDAAASAASGEPPADAGHAPTAARTLGAGDFRRRPRPSTTAGAGPNESFVPGPTCPWANEARKTRPRPRARPANRQGAARAAAAARACGAAAWRAGPGRCSRCSWDTLRASWERTGGTSR